MDYPNTLGGFRAVFYVENERQPTDQEIWDAGVRSMRQRLGPRIAELESRQVPEWISVKNRLPDIPEGEMTSEEVLAGMWFEDSWLIDDHPNKVRFIMGVCRVLRTDDLRNFPQGKQWLTFGPSHNQIQLWLPVKGLLPVKPADSGEVKP